MLRCLPLLLLGIPSVALAVAPGWLAGGAAGVEGPSVEVPLYRGVEADGRPLVQVGVGDETVLAVLAAIGGPTRIGSDLAARLGLTVRTDRSRGEWMRFTTIPEVRLGDMTLHKVRARVVAGDALVLGLGAVDDIAVAVLPSEGVVRVVHAADGDVLLTSVGEPMPLRRQPSGAFKEHGERRHGDGLSASAEVAIASLPDGRRLNLRTDVARSRIQPEVLPSVGSDGVRRAELVVEIGGLTLPSTLALVDGGLVDADAEVVGVLGYDALFAVDIARAGDRLAVRAAPSVTWHDPAPLQIAEAKARLSAWQAERGPAVDTDRPERMTFETSSSVPEGDPGDPVAAAFHRDLSTILWTAGVSEPSVQRALEASQHAGDHCLAHLELGERRLRTAGSRLTQAFVAELVRQPLEHAGTLYRSWKSLDPATRERVRHGRPVDEGVLQIEQPDACGAAWGTLMAAWLAVDDLERVSALYTLHRPVHRSVPQLLGLAMLDPDPKAAEARFREALAAGGREDVDLRLALARAQVAQDQAEPALAWLETLPWREIEHPLTAALIASSLGAPLPPLHAEPGVLAAHVAHAVRGGEVDVDAVEAALGIAEQRWPGSSQLEAMRAVWMAVGGTPIPVPGDRLHLADTWAARAAVAALASDAAALASALAELRARYPEIPAGNLGLEVQERKPPRPGRRR